MMPKAMAGTAPETTSTLRLQGEPEQVYHSAIKHWPTTVSGAYWKLLVATAEMLGAGRVVEIGCGYGLHVDVAEDLEYTGVDYGYFVEFAQHFAPRKHWVKLDFDRYDVELFSTLFDAGAVYFVRGRIEHVRDPDLLVSCLSEFAARGSVVVIAHEPRTGSVGAAKMSSFFRRRLSSDLLLQAFRERGLEATVVGDVAAPEESSPPTLSLVVASGRRDFSSLSKSLAELLSDINTQELPPSKQANASLRSTITPESMLFTPETPLLTRRLAGEIAPTDEVDVEQVETQILEAKAARRPFALVRLGNGEGRVLGFPDFVSPIWLSRSIRNWFGSREPEMSLLAMQDEGSELIAEADVLGVTRKSYRDTQYSLPLRVLGLYGLASSTARLCPADVHLQLLHAGFYGRLLSGEKRVSLVSGHELGNAFQRAFGVPDVRLYKIPAQAKFFFDPTEERHFPNAFERIRHTLEVRSPGEVFLIGAGYLGKIYCGWVKRQGGIAIDIGSVFDLWAGEQTRSGSAEVVASYRLEG